MAADNGVQTTDGGRAGGGAGQVRGERWTPGCQGEKIPSPRGAAEPGNNETILHSDRMHPPGWGGRASATRQRGQSRFLCSAGPPQRPSRAPPPRPPGALGSGAHSCTPSAHFGARRGGRVGRVGGWGGIGSDKADFCRRLCFVFMDLRTVHRRPRPLDRAS